MGTFFRVDGKFYTVMSKVADMALLSVFWIIGCLPVVTLVTSTASLYHTVVKCVRYDTGAVFRDFKEAYKKNLRQGIGLTLLFGAMGAILAFADYWLFFVSKSRSALLLLATLAALLLSVVYVLNVLWLVPVFSRFSNTFNMILKLNYVISMRHLLRCIPVIVMIAVAVILLVTLNGLLFFVPALVTLLSSYFAEPVLWRYMPKQEDTSGDWRYGFK